jgi:uncharacterized NAD-dependent epimerase/dehydratase family protein
MVDDHIPSAEDSINSIAGMPRRGEYKIVRTDGTETVHAGKPTTTEIIRLIRCSGLDTVTIDRRRQTVMFVDDTGMIDGKPVNAKATALYHAVCRPGTTHQIHGDVVIVPAGGLV